MITSEKLADYLNFEHVNMLDVFQISPYRADTMKESFESWMTAVTFRMMSMELPEVNTGVLVWMIEPDYLKQIATEIDEKMSMLSVVQRTAFFIAQTGLLYAKAGEIYLQRRHQEQMKNGGSTNFLNNN